MQCKCACHPGIFFAPMSVCQCRELHFHTKLSCFLFEIEQSKRRRKIDSNQITSISLDEKERGLTISFCYLTSAIIIIINGSSKQLATETWTGRDRSPHRFRSHRLILLQFHLDEAHLFTCSSKCDIFIKARQRGWGAEKKKKKT